MPVVHNPGQHGYEILYPGAEYLSILSMFLVLFRPCGVENFEETPIFLYHCLVPYASHAVLCVMRYISLSFDFKFWSKRREIWLENQGRKSSWEDLGRNGGQR
jgi:hypothetical protein